MRSKTKHTVAMAISLFYAERAAAVNVKCHRHWKLSLGMLQTEIQGVTGEQSHCVFFPLILLAFNWNHKLISIHFKILFWIVFLQSHHRVCLHLVQERVLLGCCVIFFPPLWMHFLENGLFSPAQAASRLLGTQQKGDQRLPRQVPEAKFLCFLYIFIVRNGICR